MKTVAAIGSRPIRAHHSSHMHASFLYGIELCCIRCKKLVQQKSCTRNHVRRSSFLCMLTCTSFLYKFLDYVSPPLARYARLWAASCLWSNGRCALLEHLGEVICADVMYFYTNKLTELIHTTCAHNIGFVQSKGRPLPSTHATFIRWI